MKIENPRSSGSFELATTTRTWDAGPVSGSQIPSVTSGFAAVSSVDAVTMTPSFDGTTVFVFGSNLVPVGGVATATCGWNGRLAMQKTPVCGCDTVAEPRPNEPLTLPFRSIRAHAFAVPAGPCGPCGPVWLQVSACSFVEQPGIAVLPVS